MSDYKEFIEQKRKTVMPSGFIVKESDLNPKMYDFQKSTTAWALSLGRAAVWADCGLGKTVMQLGWAHRVAMETGGPVLVLCPLAVANQTIAEGQKFGIDVSGIKDLEHVDDAGIYITNYEQLHAIDTSVFTGVVLDESSILKNFEGKTRNMIIDRFQKTPYKLACTATPSPNDVMEIGNHAEFLGVMKRSEMLAMFFVHDGGQTSKWRLKKHAKSDFYAWVGTWAKLFTKPSDIGFSDDGFILPPLQFHEKQIVTPKRDNGLLFNNTAVSATEFNGELRLTIIPRMEEAARIVNESDENFVIWTAQNKEGEMIRKLVPDAVSVSGSMPDKKKRDLLLGFAAGDFRVLETKTKIAGMGMNYQNCSNQIFASLDFSFEKLYQGIRRSWRFGQKKPVNIFIITTDTMQNVINTIKEKEKQFETLRNEMKKAMNYKTETGENSNTDHVSGEMFDIYRGDCVEMIEKIEDNSVGLSVFSPPFADLYTYSDFAEDMGNSKDYNEFLIHFGFLVKELFRVTQPGRNVCVHCMDLPIQKGKEGFIGLRDFSGMILNAFNDAGFIYHDRVTIWKDPVTEMQRTKALGLLHKQIKKNAAMSRTGIPDYILSFRKPGDSENPVTHQDKDPNKPDYLPVDLWQKYASPVWLDINYSDTLQYTAARDGKDERHICPLQLPTIKRLIHLYSNEGDLVLSPFMGIGSEGFQAVLMNRRFAGIELKPSYFNVARQNLIGAELKNAELTLF